jgi:nucleotide-binding universal stress UspA family protein
VADPSEPSEPEQTEHSLLRQAQDSFQRIFVPVNYSPESYRAACVALELQRIYGSDVCLFNVHHADPSDEFLGGLGFRTSDANGEAKAKLLRFIEDAAPGAGAEVELRTRIGGEAEKAQLVIAEAEDWDATLVVLTESRRAAPFRSMAERVVHGSHLAVLALPELVAPPA